MSLRDEIANIIREHSYTTLEVADALTTERAKVAKLEAEIDRLNKCLTYEQHRAGRQGTHWDGCHTGGPEHYQCALRRVAELESMLEEIAATDPVIGGSAHD